MKIYVVVSKNLGRVEAKAAFHSKALADAYRGRLFCDHMLDVCTSDFNTLECELYEVDEGPVDIELKGLEGTYE